MFQNARQIILKVTRDCNYRCKYCYVFDKDKYKGELMSQELFESVLHKWFSESKVGDMPNNLEGVVFGPGSPKDKKAELGNIPQLSLVFHGGEPLLLGKEKFATYCKIATQLARKYRKNLEISLQTNASLIDKDWIELFNKYGISPGVSWDGLCESSDNRDKDSNIINKILFMKTYNLRFGLILILHKGNYKNITRDIKVLQTLGINNTKINRGVDVTTKNTNDSEFELTSDELMEVSKEIMYFMFSHPEFKEEVLYRKMLAWDENITQGMSNFRGNVCYTRYCGAGNSLIEVEPDGNVLFCGRNSKQHALVTKNAFEKDICELKHIHHSWQFHKNKVDSVNELKCNLCPSQTFCDYGCLSFSYQKFDKPKIDNVTCEYNKALNEFFNLHKDLIVDLIKKEKKNEPYLSFFR